MRLRKCLVFIIVAISQMITLPARADHLDEAAAPERSRKEHVCRGQNLSLSGSLQVQGTSYFLNNVIVNPGGRSGGLIVDGGFGTIEVWDFLGTRKIILSSTEAVFNVPVRAPDFIHDASSPKERVVTPGLSGSRRRGATPVDSDAVFLSCAPCRANDLVRWTNSGFDRSLIKDTGSKIGIGIEPPSSTDRELLAVGGDVFVKGSLSSAGEGRFVGDINAYGFGDSKAGSIHAARDLTYGDAGNGVFSGQGHVEVFDGLISTHLPTGSFGTRGFIAVSATEALVRDSGDGVLTSEGVAVVMIDPIFAESAGTLIPRIHLTPHSPGMDLYYDPKEITANHFVVRSGSRRSGSFTWEISAVARGYEGLRIPTADQLEAWRSH